ncbi:putative acetyltransferase [Symmachiella macrocystis]|uniref:Putative acetyltransferase n=1 Tax=Symmachiella macrocystis TaxID=2527985 RepID=A0A5C6BAJ0_9PLAN|nr:GNAT family N-acetyltransferase [Symmachiella macrocystis]TWU09010.1 putative acetyltransferase [Symmachiella macrocystis]
MATVVNIPRKPSRFTIRDANDRDAVAVADIVDTAFQPLRSIYQPTRRTIERQAVHRKKGPRLIGEADGRMVGTVQYDVHPDRLHAIGLAIHPDYQRMGLARLLLQSIEDRARMASRPLVVLNTIQETGNVPIFEKLGFQVVSRVVATWCVSSLHSAVHDVTMQRDVS